VTPPNAASIKLANTVTPTAPCASVPLDENGTVSGNARRPDCIGIAPVETSNEEVDNAPITPGREFGVESLWNVWADTRYLDTTDRRHGLDIDGNMGSFVIGADRSLSNDLVAGVSLEVIHSRSNGFNNGMTSDSNGFVIAPYIGYQLSRNWAIDAYLGYGRTDNNQQIAVLEGDYTAQNYSVSIFANGQYPLGKAFVRPKVSLYYAHTRADGYDMSGSIFNTPISLRMPKSSYNYGIVETSAEVNRTFTTSGGTPVMPYAELTARYEFERVNDGDILTGNLSQASTSPWSGALRFGARAMLTRSTNFEASAGYLSLGQNGLDVWEFKLFLSHYF
jgi:outer membrane autotransporter protein